MDDYFSRNTRMLLIIRWLENHRAVSQIPVFFHAMLLEKIVRSGIRRASLEQIKTIQTRSSRQTNPSNTDSKIILQANKFGIRIL